MRAPRSNLVTNSALWPRLSNVSAAQVQSTLNDIQHSRAELQHLSETQRQQNAYLAALHDTSIDLVSRLELAELLEAILARAAKLLNASHGFVFLATDQESRGEDEPAEFELKAGIGLFEAMVGERVTYGEGFVG